MTREDLSRDEKKSYRTPKLQSFGPLRSLTAAGSIMMTEVATPMEMFMMARP